jgi:CRP-like cAMP-binding protein
LTPPDRGLLMERSVARTLVPGELLFLSGDEPGRVYLIEAGVLKVGVVDDQGSETVVGLLVEGDLCGHEALIEDMPHHADVTAVGPCRVRALDGGRLMEILSRDARAGLEAARAVAEQLRKTREVALERTVGEVPNRLAGRLMELAELLGRMHGGTITVELPFDQTDLGRLAGICRESTCKTMSRFRKRGIVDYQGRELRILRPDALQRLRCGARFGSGV